MPAADPNAFDSEATVPEGPANWLRNLDAVTGTAEVMVTARPSGAGEFAAGSMIGDYRIESRLGQGGMSTVYAAVHPLIGKRAAIKVMAANPSDSAVEVQRFLQEARAANTIGHPNIVDVFSYGRLPDGRCYLVMEWLDGETLGALLAREGRLPHASVLAIVEAIASALEVAHGKGIVHRDLKPENVFLQRVDGGEPRVKLLDFGIAKLIDDKAQLGMTGTGAWVGTPLYLSPEQARSQPVDGRADIYSLGVMLFEMLVGAPPFQADNALDVIVAHAYHQPPRLRSLVPESAAIDDIVARMLAKEPEARPSLVEVRAALHAGVFQPAEMAAPRPATPRSSRTGRSSRTVAAVFVVAGVLGGGGFLTAGYLARTERRASLAAPRSVAASTSVVPPASVAPPVVVAPPPVVVSVAPADRGTLRVECDAPGASLRVDRALATFGEPIEIVPGRHAIEIRAPRHVTFQDEVEIEAGQDAVLRPSLRRREPDGACDPRNPLCDR